MLRECEAYMESKDPYIVRFRPGRVREFSQGSRQFRENALPHSCRCVKCRAPSTALPLASRPTTSLRMTLGRRLCQAARAKASRTSRYNKDGVSMREVVVVSSVRTPVGRAFKGTLRATRPDELAAVALKGALDRVPQLDPKEIEDVILGCAMPEAEQGMNVARIASLRAGLPVEVSAVTINRFCSSGLQAIAMAAERIMSGGADVMVAGGTESMSMIPMGGNKISPNPWLVDHYPDAYLSMGLTAERLAARFGIIREQCDAFSLRSHQKALAAIVAGKFEDETVAVPVSFTANGSNGHVGAAASAAQDGRGRPSLRGQFKRQEMSFKVDEGPRADTSIEALGALKAAFHVKGVTTAGNSSQMSDGAAAAVVMSAERAKALGIAPLARYVAFATAGYKPEEMGLGPVFAI